MRLVPHQSDNEITQLFTDYFKSIPPKSVKVEVCVLIMERFYVSPTDIIAYKAASQAMKTTYGKEPVPVRSGGVFQ